jgi:hypothetical protein
MPFPVEFLSPLNSVDRPRLAINRAIKPLATDFHNFRENPRPKILVIKSRSLPYQA